MRPVHRLALVIARHRAVVAIALLIAAVGGALAVASCTRGGATKPKPTGAEIHGSVWALVGTRELAAVAGKPTLIPLPGFTLQLTDAKGAVIDHVTTDLRGRYRFPHEAPGTYLLRWSQAGFVAGQYAQRLVIGSHTLFLNPVEVRPFAGTDAQGKAWGWAAGDVRLIGGGAPIFHDEATHELKIPEIVALDAGGHAVAPKIHPNTAGQYLLTAIPAGDITVRATIDAAQAEVALPAARIGVGAQATLTFPDHRPEVLMVRFAQGGKPITGGAAAGSTVDVAVSARDLDNDALTFGFATSAGGGTITPGANGAATWKLPDLHARLALFVTVADGKGGFDQQQVWLTSGQDGEVFGTRVVDQAGAPVAGAEVEVNGDSIRTDADGAFTLPVKHAARYVVDIRAHGFALLSRIVDRGARRTWQLTPARVSTIDPTKPIEITDAGDPRRKDRSPWLGFVLGIPADGLVDATGAAPAGPLTAAVAALDITAGEMPGDWSARDGADIVSLLSYGGAFVEFTDAAGKRFNLKQGVDAKVVLRVPPTLAANAPAEIPLWSYDEKDGRWAPNGAAKFDPAAKTYVGAVKHFSTLNADQKFGQSGCLAFKLENPTMQGHVKARVTEPSHAHFAQAFEFLLDSEFNAIYRLPANIDVKVELLDDLGQPIPNALISDGNHAPLAGGIVNTAGPVADPFPPADSGICTLVRLDLSIPPWQGQLDSPPTAPFLTLVGAYDVGADATVNQPDANGYYAAVDPAGTRQTLGGWWAANGFDAATGLAGDEAHATYLNNNDLGFGRDMHMRVQKSGANVVKVAAYVTNYGGPDQDLFNVNEAAHVWQSGISQAERDTRKGAAVATVCMEWSDVEAVPWISGAPPAKKIVKFFVYLGGLGNAPRSETAVLDAHGAKYVPMLCQNCHGSERFYQPADAHHPTYDELDMGASFREFDLSSFRYPGANPDDAGAQKQALRDLNQMVLASQPHHAIQELVGGWYPGANVDPVQSFRPSGWTGSPQQTLYDRVIAKSCRTCHVAFPDATEAPSSAFEQFAWNRYDQLVARQGFLQNVVLTGANRFMPHSQITYQNFWLRTGPHAPTELNTFSDGATWPAYNVTP